VPPRNGADGGAEVRRIVAEAEEVHPEPPRPLMRDLPPADPFPVDALGDLLGSAARAINDRVQAPLAIGAQSALSVATVATQGHADVMLPIGPGQARPVSCFLITVAASGERKTTSDVEALWPVRKHEAALRDRHDMDMPSYINDKIAWDKARDEAVKRGKADRAAIKAALDRLGPPPAAPLHPMLTCPEPTFEGLCRLFALGWPSLGIFATEGGQFIGGHGMSEDNRLKTAAALSSLWDGEPIRRVRAGDGAAVLPGRRLAAHLMVQPAVADIWFRDHLLADQGLLSRLLVTAPDSAAGTRFHHEERPQTDRDLKRYGARMLATLEAPLLLAAGKPNELTPRRLMLSAAARRVWIAFADHVETMLGPDGELRPIARFANKLPEHAARLAGVLTLAGNIDAGEIAASEMAAGIELAQHYAAEALRLDGGCRISTELRLAQQARDWLLIQWSEPAISLPDLYRRGPGAIREAATARKAVGILEDHGWLVRIPEGAVIAGERRREAWRIVRG
jgi:hypothetical protein